MSLATFAKRMPFDAFGMPFYNPTPTTGLMDLDNNPKNMQDHSNQNQENQSRAVANQPSRRKSRNKAANQFIDNGPEAMQLQKLQEMADNSPQTERSRAFQEGENPSGMSNGANVAFPRSEASASTAQRVIKGIGVGGDSILGELIEILKRSADDEERRMYEDPGFELHVMDEVTNEDWGSPGGDVKGMNGHTKYNGPDQTTVVLNMSKIGDDRGAALRVLSHEVNLHVLKGYRERRGLQQGESPREEELLDHIKILDVGGTGREVVKHRERVLATLLRGRKYDDFAGFLDSWRTEINEQAKVGSNLHNKWMGATKKGEGARDPVDSKLIQALGSSGDIVQVGQRAKSVATLTCVEQFGLHFRDLPEGAPIPEEAQKADRALSRAVKNDAAPARDFVGMARAAGSAVAAKVPMDEQILGNLDAGLYGQGPMDLEKLRKKLGLAEDDATALKSAYLLISRQRPPQSVFVTDALKQRLIEATDPGQAAKLDNLVSASEVAAVSSRRVD